MPDAGFIGIRLTQISCACEKEKRRDTYSLGSGKVIGLDSTPLGVEILGDEPAMAAMRQMFTTKQAAVLKNIRLDAFLNFSLTHQV